MRNPTFVVNPKIQIGISDRRKRRNAGIQKGHHEIARPGRPQPRFGACQLNTRSNGTVARSLPESKEICATRAALSKSPEATGTVIGTNPVNQPVVLSSVGVLRVSVVVTTSNVSQLVNSRSARAAQAKTPPLKRAPAATQAASNRSPCCSSISVSVSSFPVWGTDRSPSGNGSAAGFRRCWQRIRPNGAPGRSPTSRRPCRRTVGHSGRRSGPPAGARSAGRLPPMRSTSYGSR